MDYKQKRQHVLRYVKLGMALYESMVLAGLTKKEMADLENDTRFARRIEAVRALQEYELLEAHGVTAKIAASKGNAHPIEWRLTKLNPGRYGAAAEKEKPPDKIVIIPPPKPGTPKKKKPKTKSKKVAGPKALPKPKDGN